jgi:RNA polymerase sigma factor (sigma-70 family)
MARKTDWSLSRETFELLLARLDDEPERAAVEYERLRGLLIRLFRYRGCGEPAELADEVINRVARRIEQGETVRRDEVANYFFGVARNVLREYQRDPDRFGASLDDLPHGAHPAEDPRRLAEAREERLAAERRLGCLEECLGELPAETRRLVVAYYEGEEGVKIRNRRELAEELGVSVNSLRIRMHRIREKLERCVAGCVGRDGG